MASLLHNKLIDRKTWFTNIIGFKEKNWNFNLNNLPLNIIQNTGKFNLIKLHNLKTNTKLNDNNSNILLTIFTRSNWNNEEYFDTSSLQFNTTEKSIFQVASNFNCLEVGSCTRNPFDYNYLSFLMEDATQGPSACGGAVFGSIKILSEHYKNKISLLDETNLQDKNGKLYENKITQNEVNDLNIDTIKIGLLQNTKAIIDRNKTLENKIIYNSNGIKIDQLFTSTCICRIQTKKSIALQTKLLTVSYESIYLIAIKKQLLKIVLTFVGGGVFNNDINTIIKIICNTHNKYSKFLNPNCKVILPIYIPKQNNNLIKQFNKYMKINHIHLN